MGIGLKKPVYSIRSPCAPTGEYRWIFPDRFPFCRPWHFSAGERGYSAHCTQPLDEPPLAAPSAWAGRALLRQVIFKALHILTFFR